MSEENEVRFSLTLMINKEKTKVLFASVDSSFVDVLLSFLTLPLERILRLLIYRYGEKAPAMGSLKTLYDGLENLENAYFWTEAGKMMLLNSRSSLRDECCKLKININSSLPTKYFICECWKSDNCAKLFHDCDCDRVMKKEIQVKDVEDKAAKSNHSEVFAKKSVSFLISDDLRVLPNLTGSIIHTLNRLGVTDIEGAELSTVTVGFDEIIDLLKGSLFSETPLTDLFLHESQKHQSTAAKPKLPFPLVPRVKKEELVSSKKMNIKIVVQKSNKKFLFAQAEADFIDFLFSMLTIPLGDVECLLDSNSSLGSIDNDKIGAL